jgi:HEAT repeat protein
MNAGMNASSNDELAEVTTLALAAAGPAALPGLRARLASADPNERWWALRALAEIADPQVPPLLTAALHDPEATVRQCAALALCQQPSAAALPALASTLSSEDRLLARLAAAALAAAGPTATRVLVDILQNGPQPARLEAARALATLRDPAAIPVLFAALEDESALIAHWAEQGLENLGVGMAFFKPG